MVGAATQLPIEAITEEVGALAEWALNNLWGHDKGSGNYSKVLRGVSFDVLIK